MICVSKRNFYVISERWGIIYETLLTSPGMNDAVKIDLRLPRKNVLLLTKVIELGLSLKDEEAQGGWLRSAGKETLDELSGVCAELLKKASLSDMYEKLNALHSK